VFVLVFVSAACCVVSSPSIDLDKDPKNVSEIIRDYGYPCEDHLTPPTSDGWKLSIQRIPYGKKNTNQTRKGVVFFQHGLTDSSVGVTLNPPFQSLSYILADNGYDVWLGNNRGNGYSMENIHYTHRDKEFWDFSWDEMATIDMPAQISYVLEQTGQSKLTYIGHSEGTIQAFAGFLANSSLVNNVNLYVALAPVAYVQYVESIIVKALAALRTEDIFFLLGVKDFNLPNAINALLPGFCTIDPGLCKFSIDLICGPTTYLNTSREGYYLHYEPNPTSVKNMAHWAQGVRAGTFAKYDYGKKGNIQHYDQPTPPEYDLTKFPTQTELPMALFAGGEDYLADPKDVERLLSLLPTPPFVKYESTYAHLDPLIGTNAYEWIYPIILQLLDQIWVEGRTTLI